LLCGGYFGSWLTAETFERTEITAPGLAAAGSAIGAGIFLVLPQHTCALAETTRIADYLANESAGQCGPCHNGLPALARALRQLTADGGTVAAHTIQTLIPYVERRGACHLPDGASRMIASALTAFPDEVRAHANRRPCPATRRPGRRYGS
jgi:NADH:ubiquinone oxidoreductase subunit F (NADH-binding)